MMERRRQIWLWTVTAVMAIALAIPYSEARKIKTKHSIPKSSVKELSSDISEEAKSISLASDSITFCDMIRPAIRFYGFDKTVGSNIESFFIKNGLDEPLQGIEIVVTYTDMKGRQLHKRRVKVDCEVPPHETLHTDIKSWDTQKSFYFHQSAKPKRQATPFDAKIELVSVNIRQQ